MRPSSPSFHFALILGLLGLYSAGCMHKSVMDDNADDVIATNIYSGPEGSFILSWEEVFQATSKESGGGVTHISGYSERRLSTYDLNTGSLISRAELGEQIEEANAYLGWTKGKIWMFSIDPELGLHYLNPATLEVEKKWPEISEKTKPHVTLAQAEWAVIHNFFSFDWESSRVVLTDIEGYRYHLDPETFALTQTKRDMPRVAFDEDTYSQSGEFESRAEFRLDGDPRKEITPNSGAALSFLSGQWILDRDPLKAGRVVLAERKQLESKVRMLQDSVVLMETTYPELKEEPNYSVATHEQRERYYSHRNMKRNLEDEQRNLTRLDENYRRNTAFLLSADEKSAFVRSASSISDTAHCIITKIKLSPEGSWTTEWTSHLQGVYHDYNKADKAGAFETVFSKGNPSFDYTWAGTDGKHLFIIEQLRMYALDIQTGKLVWDRSM